MNLQDLIELLQTSQTAEEIDAHREDILEFFPDLRVMVGYDQKNYAHLYDLWFHSLHTVVYLPRAVKNEANALLNDQDDQIQEGGIYETTKQCLLDPMLYLGALLHDIGKPQAQCRGKDPDDPYMHYYGHQVISKQIVKEQVIPHLKEKGIVLSVNEEERLLFYVEHHDDHISLSRKRVVAVYEVRPELFYKLMYLEVADAKAHVMISPVISRIENCSKLCDPAIVNEILSRK